MMRDVAAKLISRRDLEFLLYEWLDVEQLCARPRYRRPLARDFRFGAVIRGADRGRALPPHRRKSDLEEPVSTASMCGCCRRSRRRSPHSPMQGCWRRLATTSWAACSCQWSSTRRPSPGSAPQTPRPRAMRCSRSATPTCCWLTAPGPGRCVRATDAGGTRHGDDVPLGAAGGLLARRHRDPRRTGRHERRSGRAIGCMAARCGSRAASTSSPKTSCISCSRRFRRRSRRASRAFRCSSCRRSWSTADGHPGRAQRRRAGRPEPQDGLSRHRQHAAQFRRRQVPARAAGRRDRLPGRRAAPGPACMFHMMNEARIGVGLGAVDARLCRLSRVARLRAEPAAGPSAGRAARIRRSRRFAIVEHADVQRMLLAQKAYVEGGLALDLYCARLVDEQNTGDAERGRRRAGCCSKC